MTGVLTFGLYWAFIIMAMIMLLLMLTAHRMEYINAYWRYFWYIIDHKRRVYKYGRYLGLSRWRLLKHDMTKFLPVEFFAYAHHFHMPKADDPVVFSQRLRAFERAWEHHWQYNDHHWNYWIRSYEFINGEEAAFYSPMPFDATLEMLADWAAMSSKFSNTVDEWFFQQIEDDNISLHAETLDFIIRFLNTETRYPFVEPANADTESDNNKRSDYE